MVFVLRTKKHKANVDFFPAIQIFNPVLSLMWFKAEKSPKIH